jgi:hypothetical protein
MHISEKMMQQMAILRRQQSEVGYVIAAIRERGDPLAANLETELLKREVIATLAACDRVGLESDADRLSFCLLEITTFAGLRDLPKLQGLLNYSGGSSDDKMISMLQAMPPPVWAQIAAKAPEVRKQRGIE